MNSYTNIEYLYPYTVTRQCYYCNGYGHTTAGICNICNGSGCIEILIYDIDSDCSNDCYYPYNREGMENPGETLETVRKACVCGDLGLAKPSETTVSTIPQAAEVRLRSRKEPLVDASVASG